MKIRARALVAVAILVLLPAAFAKHAPNLEMKDLNGSSHHLADLRGSIVVLNFWATWCVPCREELPMLSALTREYSAKGVRFVAASADQAKDRAKVDSFLSRDPVAMDVWVGADLDMLERAQLGEVLPATIILDQQGEVIARVMGEAREQDIRQPLDWLLSGKAGTPPQAVTKRY